MKGVAFFTVLLIFFSKPLIAQVTGEDVSSQIKKNLVRSFEERELPWLENPLRLNFDAKDPTVTGTFVLCAVIPNGIAAAYSSDQFLPWGCAAALEFAESIMKRENPYNVLIVFLDDEFTHDYVRKEDEENPFDFESLQDILDSFDEEQQNILVSLSFLLPPETLSAAWGDGTWVPPLEIAVPFFTSCKNLRINARFDARQADLSPFISEWDYDFPLLQLGSAAPAPQSMPSKSKKNAANKISAGKMPLLLFAFADTVMKTDVSLDMDRNYAFFQYKSGGFFFFSEFMLVATFLFGTGGLLLTALLMISFKRSKP